MQIVLGIECDGCDYRHTVARRGNSSVYELDSGEVVPLLAAVGFCRDCQQVVEVEVLPELAQIEKIVERLNAGDPELVAPLKEEGRFVEDEIEFNEAILTWLQERTSPPRCLECGSHSFDRFPTDGEEGEEEDSRHLPHPIPGCEGNLKFTEPGLGRGSMRPQTFDSEGELIE